ncbi:hypothetical protein [Nitrosarchaeum sp.]|uniref:hypothetical protein n=1 Tax=Nitrosarchaeum sp. TaxID=2026886 RepID=UPI00247B6E43|nr:hypothetical protein [Nitrosarchaeum sp.]MCV0411390.1 hypothetical protein [Nitrosarchaeum sp.]
MIEQEKDQEISPQTLNMFLLDFLNKHSVDYWNINEITGKAGITSNNYARVKRSLQYFDNQKLVQKFSVLTPDIQKKTKLESVKSITLESYQITQLGKDTYKKIMDSCLDSVSLRLLSIKKIE